LAQTDKGTSDLVLRNPAYFFLLFLCAVGAYVTFQLNLWGPIVKMTEAASRQAVVVGKKRLREFLESSEPGRQGLRLSGHQGQGDEYEMANTRDHKRPSTVNSGGVDEEDEPWE
jgi:hypothetical protein